LKNSFLKVLWFEFNCWFYPESCGSYVSLQKNYLYLQEIFFDKLLDLGTE